MHTSYETKQFNEIQSWKGKGPSVTRKFVNTLLKPVGIVINTIIPDSAIRGVLLNCNKASQFIIDEEEFKKSKGISEISELRNKPLEECDRYARAVKQRMEGIAVVEGGVTGLAGVGGLLVDIPATITMAMYVINKIGWCYGFKMETEEDYIFALNILSVAGSNNLKEKSTSLLTIKSLQQTLKRKSWKKIAQKAAEKSLSNEAFLITVKSVSKRLGINLTKRKALQAAPVIGAAVGAACNHTFINDVSWAAIRVYQEKWLTEKYDLN